MVSFYLLEMDNISYHIALYSFFFFSLHYKCIVSISFSGQYPTMLAPQLLGRLLTEVKTNDNIRTLLKQCDDEGPVQNALLPTYHCMHTPGGPLKYVSL